MMRARQDPVLASTITLLVSLTLLATPAAASLIGYWSFQGCTTTDASGNSRDLTAQAGPACVAGRFNDAWSLNGTTQCLDHSGSPAFTPGARDWSVAVWEKSSSVPGYAALVSWYRCGANPSCAAPDAAYYAISIGQGHPIWDVRDDDAHQVTVNDTLLNVADGGWHFIVGTMNRSTRVVRMYVDGVLRGSVTAAPGTLGLFSGGAFSIPLEVGRWYRTGWEIPAYYFPGAIDEVRIFDEELSAAVVRALYTSNNVTTAVAAGEGHGLAIERTTPNPLRGGPLAVAFTLPAAEPARLALFDVSGRLLSWRAVGALGAGRHQVVLSAGVELAPGVYFVELRQGAQAQRRRVSVLD